MLDPGALAADPWAFSSILESSYVIYRLDRIRIPIGIAKALVQAKSYLVSVTK